MGDSYLMVTLAYDLSFSFTWVAVREDYDSFNDNTKDVSDIGTQETLCVAQCFETYRTGMEKPDVEMTDAFKPISMVKSEDECGKSNEEEEADIWEQHHDQGDYVGLNNMYGVDNILGIEANSCSVAHEYASMLDLRSD
nr:hypothetical protein [Tanacetum cinerariifolium]